MARIKRESDLNKIIESSQKTCIRKKKHVSRTNMKKKKKKFYYFLFITKAMNKKKKITTRLNIYTIKASVRNNRGIFKVMRCTNPAVTP